MFKFINHLRSHKLISIASIAAALIITTGVALAANDGEIDSLSATDAPDLNQTITITAIFEAESIWQLVELPLLQQALSVYVPEDGKDEFVVVHESENVSPPFIDGIEVVCVATTVTPSGAMIS